MHKVLVSLVMIWGLALAGCAPPRSVAVEERVTVTRAQETEKIGGAHIRIVQSGDTLYAIAFANGLDAQRLAAWNSIGVKDKLPVGKRLRLTRPVGFVEPPKVEKTPPQRPSRATTVVASPSPPKPVVKDVNRETQPSQTAANKFNGDRWRWPSSGKVVKNFDLKRGQQGVDIAGKLGQAVTAARTGEAVYVGSGLKGYGNLVILKHGDEFLSAYAHNLETFVNEGQMIEAGQRIATMGQIEQTAALHFQIRRHGEPVNPRNYLP